MTATAIFGQSTNASLGNPVANPVSPPSAPAERSKAEIEKLVAPIALYPDPLLATLLPASAYPLEIVQAARFVKNTNNIAKLDSQPWDENVKALARFPDVIATMDTNISWTSELGQAFVQDQKSVMDAIQAMRGKAQQAGSLKTSPQQVVATTNEVVEKIVEQQVVYVTNTVVQIQPAQPQVIYVPQYNPSVVYAPAPAYAYDPVAPLVTFGVGMAVGAAIANNCDWHSGGVYVGRHGAVAYGGGHSHGDVDVNVNQNVNVNRSANMNQTRNTTVNGQKWQPDANRRTSTSTAATPEARGWGGGQASQNAAAARSQASENASAARGQASENAAAARSQASENAAAARSQASERGSAARAQASENASAARGQASANASAARVASIRKRCRGTGAGVPKGLGGPGPRGGSEFFVLDLRQSERRRGQRFQ